MSDEGTRRSRMAWIASVFHPQRMISAPTIAALQAILTGRRPSRPMQVQVQNSGSMTVSLAELPELDEVGGIARITMEGGDSVGVARVGRNSFVGYRLEADELREIEIILAEGEDQLRIVGAEVRS